jgi:calcineurin-like phosphoesterase family protein
MFTDLKNRSNMGKRIFIIGDLHLEHKDIIKYCHRPFKPVERMNKVLVNNWNRTVRPFDKVYFLGDLARRDTDKWLRKLNGKIIFIKGTHDRRSKIKRLYKRRVLRYKGWQFLLIHDPEEVTNWDGWIIHGHKHNNNVKKFPFFNPKNKTVNVSCELTYYTPVEIDKIISIIKKGRTRIRVKGGRLKRSRKRRR